MKQGIRLQRMALPACRSVYHLEPDPFIVFHNIKKSENNQPWRNSANSSTQAILNWRLEVALKRYAGIQTIWESFIALDLHKVKIIHHNCFLWPSGSQTRLFTRMCSGETDAKPELGNLLMAALHSCIPDNLICLSGRQLGNTVQEGRFETKGCSCHTQRPAQSLLQTRRSANSRWPAHPTALAHWKPFPLFIFKAGFSSSPAQVSQLSSPHQRAAHMSQLAGRGSPCYLSSLQEPHLNSELRESLREGKIWQACTGLQGFSIKKTEMQTHTCKLSPILLKLICSSGSEWQLQPHHTTSKR